MDRADYAKKRMVELAPRTSKLAVVVPDALRTDSGVEIIRDGSVLTREQWGLPVPVDAGRHTVRITATKTMKSKALWEAEIDIVAGDNVRLVVPREHEEAPVPPGKEAQPIAARPPELLPVRAPATFTPPTDDEPGKLQRRVGIGIGAVGVVALEVAGAFLAVNLTKGADYDAVCNAGARMMLNTSVPCQPGLHDDTTTTRTAVAISGIAGAVALLGGIVIYATAPASRRGAVRALAPPAGGGPGVRQRGGEDTMVKPPDPIDSALCDALARRAVAGDGEAWKALVGHVWPASLRIVKSQMQRASDDDVENVVTNLLGKLGDDERARPQALCALAGSRTPTRPSRTGSGSRSSTPSGTTCATTRAS